MVQTRKMEEGDKTPTLYSFYDDQYDFNNLSRRVDSGLNNYISTLKRGKKYESEVREAVANLMAGVKDGTITFGNGRYNDSLGRYRNAEDKDKDVYGWAANYIYNMQNVPKYNKQTTSKKYDNTILSKELSNIIFGSENGNLSYFWDVDPLDTSTNTRGIQGRLSVLGEAISQINPDTLLKDYSQGDRDRVRNQLQQVTTAISNGQLDPGELLTLGKTFGGIDWNNWLRTDFNKTFQEQQEPQEKEGLSRDKFFEYVSSAHPLYQGDLESVTLNNTAQSDELEQLAQRLSRYDNRTLQLIDIGKLDNDSKEVTLDFLISRNLLPQSDGVYIVPNSLKNETVLTYNPKTQQLSRKRTHELPYYRKQWINDYTQQYGSPTDQLSQYFTEFKKNGGIIKAETGTSFSNIYALGDNPDIGYNTYLNNIFQQQAVIDWMKSNYTGNQATKNYADYVKNNVNARYSVGINNYQNNPRYTGNNAVLSFNTGYQNNGNTLNYVLFGDSSDDYNNRTGGVVYSLQNFGRPSKPLRTGDSYNSDPSKAYIDNALGLQTYSRVASLTNPELKTGQFGQWGNYWRSLGNTGAYYYTAEGDTSGRGQWIPTSDTSISGYVPFTKEVPVDNNKKDNKKGAGSRVYPTDTQSKDDEFTGNRFGDFMLGITPDLIGTGRLFASLRTNNRVARTLDRSLRPVLKDTYERYSPITGAFSEMQFRNRQAADLRRQASRPFTSDASLQLAGQLEADRQARDLEYQGFLADDKEIKRTQEAALARQEDNMARRSEVSNFNRASINQTNREKAQLEATRLKRNWQSVDNYLQEVEGRLRTDLAERRAIRQNASMQTAQTRYQEFLQRFNEDYKRDHPNATWETMLNDPYYIQKVQDLRRRYQYDTYNIGLGRYYRDPYAGIYDKDNIPTYESILYSKNGGRLRPTIMTMINKVIKNESYT